MSHNLGISRLQFPGEVAVLIVRRIRQGPQLRALSFLHIGYNTKTQTEGEFAGLNGGQEINLTPFLRLISIEFPDAPLHH